MVILRASVSSCDGRPASLRAGGADLQLLSTNHAEPSAPGLILVLAAFLEPFSRGAVTLVSDDPTVYPRVEFRLLSDPRDWARIRLAAQELFAVLNNDAVRRLTPAVTLDERGTTPDDLVDGLHWTRG